ncbi:MAG: Adventurous gliding motility protein AgmX [Pseudomonadota bacterium]|jgi:predicted Zn finger-like uncharacterized protein
MQFACSKCNARFQIADSKVGPRGVKVPCKRCGNSIVVRRSADADAAPEVPIFTMPGSLAMPSLAKAPPPPPEPEEGESTQVLDNPLAAEAAAEALAAAQREEEGLSAPADDLDERTGVDVRPAAQPAEPSPTAVTAPVEPVQRMSLDDEEQTAVGLLEQRPVAAAEPPAAPAPAADSRPTLGDDLEEGRQSTRVMGALESEQLVSASAQEDDGPVPSLPSLAASAAPVPAPAVDWYVGVDDQQVGPLRQEQLLERWNAGSIGPDTLCWRAGMDDWLPLSRVAELAPVLAPRPPPAVVAAVAAPAARATGGFPSLAPSPSTGGFEPLGAGTGAQRAFSEPGLPLGTGPVPAVVTPSPPVDTGGWRPSAASALASLVKEEMAVLSRPPAPPSNTGPGEAFAAGEPAPRASLEVPLAEHRAAPVFGSPDVDPFAHTSPGFTYQPGGSPPSAAQPPRAPLPPAGWMPPGAPAYGQVSAPPPAPAPAPPQRNVALVVIGVAILVALGGIALLLIRQQPAAQQAQQQPQQAPVAVQPEPAPAQAVVAQVVPAAKKVEPPAEAPAEPPAPKEEAKKPEPKEEPKKAEKTERAEKKERAEKAEPKPEKREPAKVAEKPVRKEEEKVAVAPPPPPPPPREEKKAPKAPVADDDFDSIFGSAPKKKEAAAATATASSDDKVAKKSVYVPPPPAAPSEPEKLGQSDIMAVVLANKASIKQCADEQKAKEPGSRGKVVMKWTIQASGKVGSVSCQTDEFRDSYMASCLSKLIKGFQFPRHRVQGDPVVFPFTF